MQPSPFESIGCFVSSTMLAAGLILMITARSSFELAAAIFFAGFFAMVVLNGLLYQVPALPQGRDATA